MEARLEKLPCHFNWDDVLLDDNKLSTGRYKLEDFGDDEGNVWLGPIYNALAFVHHRLGSDAEALQWLTKATEVLQLGREEDARDGPWLVVNYGNLAWLHHHMGDDRESQTYLSNVEDLLSRYPNPSEDELLPEVAAEKAWTLMMLTNQREQAENLLRGAVEKQPGRVEWKSSLVLSMLKARKHDEGPLDPQVWEELENAREEDPENMCIAVKYLHYSGARGESVEDRARELAQRVLSRPPGIHNGLKSVLRLYRQYLSLSEAVDLAEQALRKDPDERYVKRCAALCYCWRITFNSETPPSSRTIDRGVALTQEVIALYPRGNLVKKINLANIYANTRRLAEADEIYDDLLARQLPPAEQQVLYHHYAKHLAFNRNDRTKSVKYHMKAARISIPSYFRNNSIKSLRKIVARGRNRMCSEIQEFLHNLNLDEP
ncbi:interferon-induced protein with tetratricopeptide repeats 2-like [Synchiropus splendidus]|uniref:interferon-induced protein with tetratricopeptide repeats 2-like n=1 Tax=Synchiropus splendidus TaxID=270530 RepID=UPI00237DFF89|nr:interferon-induced protein with tetratricopeptide repeats 2-like [Synchiropus splendidus]